MSDSKKVKQTMRRLVGKKLGKKLKKEGTPDVLLNTEYNTYQLLQTLSEICDLKQNKLIQTALTNLRKRGLSRAIAELSDVTQLAAFLQEYLPDAGGGIGDEEDEYI